MAFESHLTFFKKLTIISQLQRYYFFLNRFYLWAQSFKEKLHLLTTQNAKNKCSKNFFASLIFLFKSLFVNNWCLWLLALWSKCKKILFLPQSILFSYFWLKLFFCTTAIPPISIHCQMQKRINSDGINFKLGGNLKSIFFESVETLQRQLTKLWTRRLKSFSI